MLPKYSMFAVLLAAALPAVADSLSCRQVAANSGHADVDSITRQFDCVYRNGSLAQAYAALRGSHDTTYGLAGNPYLPAQLPPRNRQITDSKPATCIEGATDTHRYRFRYRGRNEVHLTYGGDDGCVAHNSLDTRFYRQGRDVRIVHRISGS